MGYRRVVNFWCDVCGIGGKMVNAISDDSFESVKKTALTYGWKVSDNKQMLCEKCQSKGKTFDDYIKFDIE